MRIGVMSDTHGNIEFMQHAANRMIDEFNVDAIVHLGDDYADALRMQTRGIKLVAIPGVFEDAWKDKKIKHRLIEDFGGIRFFLSHTPDRHKNDMPDDINPANVRSERLADVMMHGHTHAYKAQKEDDDWIVINPGHLAKSEDRGKSPTFAIIDADNAKIYVQIVGLNGETIEEFKFEVNR